MSYEDAMEEAVRRFLQTVAVVDDRPLTETDRSLSEEDSAAVAALAPADPLAASDSTAPAADAEADGALHELTEASAVEEGGVNVTFLADGFADLDLTCSVLQPTGRPEDFERIVRVGRQADIVVLDWQLDARTGRTAEDVIRKLAHERHHGRRLVVIYTTHPNLEAVFERVESCVPEELKRTDPPSLTVDSAGLRITIYAKPAGLSDPRYASRVRDAAQLPRTVVSEFARLCQGLVPAATLHALAATRENTHRLLGRLDESLDVGFAGHVLRLDHPEDAVGHLLDAISGELRAIVEDDPEARAAAGVTAIEHWYEGRSEVGRLSVDGLRSLIEGREPTAKRWRAVGLRERSLTQQLVPEDDADAAADSDARLALLFSLRYPYGDGGMPLHLGTIVRELEYKDFFWLCLQPVCDSVRLRGPTAFPMLQLDLATDPARQRFRIVVRDVDDTIRSLHARGKPSDIEMMQFEPSEGRVRFARSENRVNRTVSTVDGRTLAWLGQLKPAHSQRIVVRLSGELSRVGLDESEWLRLRGESGGEQAPAVIDRRTRRREAERDRDDSAGSDSSG